MESSGKKRKLSSDHHHQDYEDDNSDINEEVEKFFALIKGIREARDRLLMNRSDFAISRQQEKKNKRKLDGEENNNNEQQQQVTVWKPSFQPEDFLEEYLLLPRNPKAIIVENSQRNEVIAEKEESKDGLDLRLSL